MRLEIQNITKRFGDHLALDGVSLRLESVKSLVLIGPSGGGKTTLLRILAGLEHAEAGTVSFDGQRLGSQERELEAHRRSVGTVFQAFNLFPHLSALENILLPLEKVHGHPPAEAREIAMGLLRRFQLDARAHQRPAALSGGQKQRVAIIRAIAIKPRVLFLDEPTSSLDPEMTAEVLGMIEELKSEGRDFVLVTHQMGFAKAVADHVLFLSHGKLVEHGAAREILENATADECRLFLAKTLKYG